MELVGKIFIAGFAVYLGHYVISHWPGYIYEVGICVGVAAALSMTY